MIEKSYVSTERRICIVCGADYDTNAILIDKRLRARLDRHTITGWGLCSKDQQLFNAGFLALVEIDLARSGSPPAGASIRPEQAYRTGLLVHLRRDIATHVFNVPIRQDLPCVFVEPGLISRLELALQTHSERSN